MKERERKRETSLVEGSRTPLETREKSFRSTQPVASSTLAEHTGVSSGFEKKAGYRVKGKREGDGPLPIQAKSFSREYCMCVCMYVH